MFIVCLALKVVYLLFIEHSLSMSKYILFYIKYFPNIIIMNVPFSSDAENIDPSASTVTSAEVEAVASSSESSSAAAHSICNWSQVGLAS